MKINARTLAHLDLAYSIARLPAPPGADLPAIAAGSEGNGPLLMFRPPDYRPETIAGAPGGFISLCPLRWGGRPFLAASTSFKPIFQAAECRLAAYPLDRGELPESLGICAFPYTHRIASFHVDGKSLLLASTLCSAKAFQDDWSKPGGVFVADVPSAPGEGESGWRFQPILEGLSKNHGMDEAVLHHGRRGFLLSAHDGLFFIGAPVGKGAGWTRETIAEGEYSDAFAFPWDDPLDPQVFSLSPFHGNVLSRHRRTAAGWSRETLDDSIEFGHVLWAGMILGRPGLLVGGRGGMKQLAVYSRGDGNRLEKQLIDEGAGPTQVAVVERGAGEAIIFVAAHARGEVVEYILRS
jgi:hypothetical protein